MSLDEDLPFPVMFALSLAGAQAISPAVTVQPQDAAPQEQVSLTPAQLFDLADAARAGGKLEVAEQAYRALASNPAMEIRNEARFRLALLLADGQPEGKARTREAAVLLREILDEQPNTARVRVELARLQALMGNLREAERELRAAEAAGLPPEVQQMVRFYASALNARRRVGGNFEVAIAPDSNINRATRSDTLGTVIGDFTLDNDARQQSGIGLAAKAQGYVRLPLSSSADIVTSVSGTGAFYRKSAFNDYGAAIQSGPQLRSGKDRIELAAVASWRWFGGDPYSFSYGANGEWRHPLDPRTQLRTSAGYSRNSNQVNDLQDSNRYSLSAGLDRAFSARAGGGLTLYGSREVARDAGYSTASGGVSSFVYREFGKTTGVLSFGYNRLAADERLFLYPERRVDNRFTINVSGTFRALKAGSFAPYVRAGYERNRSTIEIYDYGRVSAEFGVTAAF